MAEKTEQVNTITCDRCNAEKQYNANNSIEGRRGWSSLKGQRNQGGAIKGMQYGCDLCPSCTEQFEAWYVRPTEGRLTHG